MFIFEWISRIFFPSTWQQRKKEQLLLEEQSREADKASLKELEEQLAEEQRIEQENFCLQQEVFISKTYTLYKEILNLNILFAKAVSETNKTSILLDDKKGSKDNVLEVVKNDNLDSGYREEQIISELLLLADMFDIYFNLALDVLFGKLEIAEAVRILMRRTWVFNAQIISENDQINNYDFNNGKAVDIFHLLSDCYPTLDSILTKKYYDSDENASVFTEVEHKGDQYFFRAVRLKNSDKNKKQYQECALSISDNTFSLEVLHVLRTLAFNIGENSVSLFNFHLLLEMIDRLILVNSKRIEIFSTSNLDSDLTVENMFSFLYDSNVFDFTGILNDLENSFRYDSSEGLDGLNEFNDLSFQLKNTDELFSSLSLNELVQSTAILSKKDKVIDLFHMLKTRVLMESYYYKTIEKGKFNYLGLSYEYYKVANWNDGIANSLGESLHQNDQNESLYKIVNHQSANYKNDHNIAEYWSTKNQVSDNEKKGRPIHAAVESLREEALLYTFKQDFLISFSAVEQFIKQFRKAEQSPVFPQNFMVTGYKSIQEAVEPNIKDVTDQIKKMQVYIAYLKENSISINKEQVLEQFESAVESIDEYYNELIIETDQAISATAEIMAEDFDNKNFNFDRIVAFNRSERRRKQKEKDDSKFFEEIMNREEN